MSFGFSIGDFVLLTKLAYTTVQNARDACGVHDSLTKEANSIHIILRHLEAEVAKPESILNKPEDNRKQELTELARGCRSVLRILSQILEKYNALPTEKKRVTKLWQKIRFGNGEMQDLGKIRSELATYTQAITIFLNLLSIGSQGKVEKYMDSHGEELREIKHSLTWVTASLQANIHEEGSILTSYAEDDKAVWKSFRRELIKEGFSSDSLGKHKKLIKRYISELCERGALDDVIETCNEADSTQTATLEGQNQDIQESSSSTSKSNIAPTRNERVDMVDLRKDPGQSVSHHRPDLSHSCGNEETLFEWERGESSIDATNPPVPQGRRPQKSLDDAEAFGNTARSPEGTMNLEKLPTKPQSSGDLEEAGVSLELEPQLLQVETHDIEGSVLHAVDNSNADDQFLPNGNASDEGSEKEAKTTTVEKNLLNSEQSEPSLDLNSSPHEAVVHNVPDAIGETLKPDPLNNLHPTEPLKSSPTAAQDQNIPTTGNVPKYQPRYQAYIEDLADEEYLPEAHPNCFSEEIDGHHISDNSDQEYVQVRHSTSRVHQHPQARYQTSNTSAHIPISLTPQQLRIHECEAEALAPLPGFPFQSFDYCSTGGAATLGSDDDDYSAYENFGRRVDLGTERRSRPSATSSMQRERVLELAERLRSHVSPVKLEQFRQRMLKNELRGINNPLHSSDESLDEYPHRRDRRWDDEHYRRRDDRNTISRFKSSHKDQRVAVPQRRVWVSKPDESSFVELHVTNGRPVTSQNYELPSEDEYIISSDDTTSYQSSELYF